MPTENEEVLLGKLEDSIIDAVPMLATDIFTL
jgi:hypothetical protein